MTKIDFIKMLEDYPDDIIIKILNSEKQLFVTVVDKCQIGDGLCLLYDDKSK
jgi:hypothetical protein